MKGAHATHGADAKAAMSRGAFGTEGLQIQPAAYAELHLNTSNSTHQTQVPDWTLSIGNVKIPFSASAGFNGPDESDAV